MCGNAYFVDSHTLVRLIAIMRFHCSTVRSMALPASPMPALAYSTSSLPRPDTVSATMRSTCSGTVTSTLSDSARLGALSLMAAAVSAAPLSLMSAHITRAPSAANSCAAARPMPEPAPVTIATFPYSLPAITSSWVTTISGYAAERPPSSGIAVPVIHPDSSLARTNARLAQSSTSPMRWIGLPMPACTFCSASVAPGEAP